MLVDIRADKNSEGSIGSLSARSLHSARDGKPDLFLNIGYMSSHSEHCHNRLR